MVGAGTLFLKRSRNGSMHRVGTWVLGSGEEGAFKEIALDGLLV